MRFERSVDNITPGGPSEKGSRNPSAAGRDTNEWFDRRSVIRSVSQEALCLLGGGRAVLLQLAHPLIAAGVLQHSDFQDDPLSRLLQTIELMHTLIFADRLGARAALEHFYAAHASIQGRLPQPVGRYPAGSPYQASGPELKLWVVATLLDTSLLTHELFVADLSPVERRSFYQDSIKLAKVFKIPGRVLPPTLPDFRDYMTSMLNHDILEVNGLTRQLARQVLYPHTLACWGRAAPPCCAS